MLKVIFLLAAVAPSSLALLSEPPGLPDDWKELHYKVFGNNVAAISPDETYATLVELVKLYQGRTDELSNTRRERALALIAENELNYDKCCKDSFDRLGRLMSFHAINRINVIPYLKRARFERLKFCQARFAAELASAVDKLKPEDKEDIVSMVKTIHDSHDAQHAEHMEMFVPRQNLVDGLVDYMNCHLEEMSDKKEFKGTKGKKKLDRLFVEHVENLCRRVDGLVLPRASVYKRFVANEELMSLVDPVTKDWIIKAFVCRDVVNQAQPLVEEMQKVITNGRSKKKGICGIMKRLMS